MARVLITGASGFLGGHVLDLLNDHEVHAVTRSGRIAKRPNWHAHPTNLFDAEQVRTLLRQVRPTHLLHLAWVTAPETYRDSPENLDWLAASVMLLRAFVENGGKRVVISGSCAEYTWQEGTCDEASTPLRPVSLYGVCKNALREVLEAYAKESGISAAWGRSFFVYGPGEHSNRFVSYVIRSLLTGKVAECSVGTHRRDYIFIKDAARVFVALLFNSVSGAVNVGSGTAVEVATLARTISQLIGRPELLRVGVTPVPRDEPPLLVAGQKRLRSELGWTPAYSLEAGLQEEINYWRQQDTGREPRGPVCSTI